MFNQIIDMVNVGIVVLDTALNVTFWNRWMEIQSRIRAEEIVGRPLFEKFPELNTPWFQRSTKQTLLLGNFAFCSQKIHKYLFPLKPVEFIHRDFDYMQQNCTIGPLRDEQKRITHLFIMVQDVTDIVVYEKRLVELNLHDELTGAFNRRYLISYIETEFVRSKRYNRPFSLIMMDIDLFKSVNDTYGHLAGDRLLQSFTNLITSSIRAVDIFVRYGGEEFCCLLPEIDLASATVVADKLRLKVELHPFVFGEDKIPITVSVGVAEFNTAIESVDAFIKKADDALYEAKTNGRNRVVVAR